MNITAASLSRLDAGSNYYLSNTTGTIKKANFWQWIKCATGFGDGRAKAQRLAEAVKKSLLANAELEQDAALSGEIARLDTKHSLSGALESAPPKGGKVALPRGRRGQDARVPRGGQMQRRISSAMRFHRSINHLNNRATGHPTIGWRPPQRAALPGA